MAVSPGAHLITGTDLEKLQAILHDALPASLLMCRRIQNALPALQRPMPDAGVHGPLVVASFKPSDDVAPKLPSSFVIGFLDRTAEEGLPANVFTSLEMPKIVGDDEARCAPFETRRTHDSFIAVLRALRSYSPPDDLGTGKPDVIKIGCVHVNSMDLIRNSGLIVTDSPPYQRYLFNTHTSKMTEQDCEVPEHLVWDMIRPHDYAEIVRTNQYVKDAHAVESWRGVGIRENVLPADQARLIAWGFLGSDGSVRTLQVVHDYRRRGLARRIVLKLLHMPPDERLESTKNVLDGWSHTYAAIDNHASNALMTSIGAWIDGQACWPEIDLNRIAKS